MEITMDQLEQKKQSQEEESKSGVRKLTDEELNRIDGARPNLISEETAEPNKDR